MTNVADRDSDGLERTYNYYYLECNLGNWDSRSPQTLNFGIFLPRRFRYGQFRPQQIERTIHISHSSPFAVACSLFVVCLGRKEKNFHEYRDRSMMMMMSC